MQEKTWSKSAITWLVVLASSLFLLSACSPTTTSTSTITPESDCLPDVPCVPCIIPIPYYPVTDATLNKVETSTQAPN